MKDYKAAIVGVAVSGRESSLLWGKVSTSYAETCKVIFEEIMRIAHDYGDEDEEKVSVEFYRDSYGEDIVRIKSATDEEADMVVKVFVEEETNERN